MALALSDDFLSIVLNETPLLDVRAPIEFEKGAFIGATNLAIMNDEERRVVGTKYKEEGNAAAVALAEELIKNEGKEQRVSLWKAYLEQNPQAKLYCFRGGQRSGIAQAWLHETGIEITRLKGGYKAFRNFLIAQTEAITASIPSLIIGGRTGSGKTILLSKLENAIDLEGLAHHRGSSFGKFVDKQPSQIDFENNLAYKLIQLHHKNFKRVIIEHESHNIGKAFIPKGVYENLMQGELILLETPIEKRAEIIYDEYILLALQEYENVYAKEALKKWASDVHNGVDRIKKRLGSQLHLELKEMFDAAYEKHATEQAKELYKEWIIKLLNEYYDPMYDYQIQKTAIPILFKGSEEEVLEFIKRRDDAEVL